MTVDPGELEAARTLGTQEQNELKNTDSSSLCLNSDEVQEVKAVSNV